MKTTKQTIEKLNRIKEEEKDLLKSLLEDSINSKSLCIFHNPKNYEHIKKYSNMKYDENFDVFDRDIVLFFDDKSSYRDFMKVFEDSINKKTQMLNSFFQSDLQVNTGNNLSFFCEDLGNVHFVYTGSSFTI